MIGALENGARRARVEAIHGHVTGVTVGDHVAVHAGHLAGTGTGDDPHIFVAVFQRDGTSPLDPIAPDGGAVDGVYAAVALKDGVLSTCRDRNFGALPPLSADHVANAMLAANCNQALWAIDGRWEGGDCPDGLPGCAASGAHDNSAPTLAVVFMILILMVTLVRRSHLHWH